VLGAEIIFGMPDQKLTIRHDAGSSARPYVDGALLGYAKYQLWSDSIVAWTPCSTFEHGKRWQLRARFHD
jgi:hypothetical protein